MADGDDRPARLVLIRHGESNATVQRVVGGHQGCTGLSPLGRRQAEALRDRLGTTGELGPVAALYASVMPRAVETADLLAPALGGLPVQQDCGVCEVHPGEADGLTWQEFSDRWGDPGRDHFKEWAPGAESWAGFVARVGRSLLRLAAAHESETVVIACHGGVVEASFVALGGLPLRRPFDLVVENASITEWERLGPERWRLRRCNDAAHLAAVPGGTILD